MSSSRSSRTSAEHPTSDGDVGFLRRRGACALACCLVLVLASACGATSGPAPSLLEATIPELQKAMETGELTAVELVGPVDARMLGAQVGHLTLDEMRAVDDALELVLDLG